MPQSRLRPSKASSLARWGVCSIIQVMSADPSKAPLPAPHLLQFGLRQMLVDEGLPLGSLWYSDYLDAD